MLSSSRLGIKMVLVSPSFFLSWAELEVMLLCLEYSISKLEFWQFHSKFYSESLLIICYPWVATVDCIGSNSLPVRSSAQSLAINYPEPSKIGLHHRTLQELCFHWNEVDHCTTIFEYECYKRLYLGYVLNTIMFTTIQYHFIYFLSLIKYRNN